MARYFNGSYRFLKIAADSVLYLPDGDWSLGGWFSALCSASFKFLYGHGSFVSTPSCNILTSNGTLAVGVVSDDGCNKQNFSVAALTDYVWYHVLLNNDGDDLTVYLDGVAKWNDATATNWGTISPSGDLSLAASGEANAMTGSLAEWAKWDAALDSQQIAGLAHGVRPVDIGTRPVWYLPLTADLQSEIGGLTVTNYSSTVAAHPPQIIPAGLVA